MDGRVTESSQEGGSKTEGHTHAHNNHLKRAAQGVHGQVQDKSILRWIGQSV